MATAGKLWVTLGATVVSVAACSSHSTSDNTPEQAVQSHVAAAQAGDVEMLRGGACGKLAAAMREHSDDEVRQEFRRYYQPAPDQLTTPSASATPTDRQTVTGLYTSVTDLGVVFYTENHDGWKVCEVRKDNGPFGRLPGPFEGN